MSSNHESCEEINASYLQAYILMHLCFNSVNLFGLWAEGKSNRIFDKIDKC